MSTLVDPEASKDHVEEPRRLGRERASRRRRLARTLVAITLAVAVCAGLFVFRDEIWGPKFNHSGYSLSRDGQSPYIGQ